jgi:asparagine synthase (glutamine-hydrolysing)
MKGGEMGDFYLDMRVSTSRNSSTAENSMRYYKDIIVKSYEFEQFTLVLSRPDDFGLWGPYSTQESDVFVALSGRIALDGKQWEEAKDYEGQGGLACKAIYKMYKSDGIDSLDNLNGSYAVFVFDMNIQKFYIILDRCGMFPCFEAQLGKNELVFSSHPDILATVLGLSDDWDMTSMAEFLMTGKVSFPYSYYKNIQALDYGCIHTIDLKAEKAVYESKRKYFDFNFHVDHRLSEWDIAEELAVAFRKAMNKRALPIFGQTAISLSGGLDSRAILSSTDYKNKIWTFCFFDEENIEYKIAKAIAREAGVKFIPLKRPFDHYGNNAEMGIKISGGLGDFGNNHYLGFRESLLNLGIDNIISGFYCDYLFKGLVLDKKANKFLRTESLSQFKYENYMPIFWFDTSYSNYVRERLDTVFPEDMRKDESEIGKLNIEHRRIFPLSYEPDNQETTVPQRVMGWYLPIVDNDIIETYLKIPPKYKLNTSIYSKMVEIQCGKTISAITNVNTGAKVNASRMTVLLHSYKTALEKRLKRKKESIASDGSWPNWPYYIQNSKKIGALWMRKNKIAEDLFKQILGKDPYKMKPQEYSRNDRELKLFLRLLTLKLWIDQHS